MDIRESATYRTIVVDGLTTAYWEGGSGEPLVLLHGGEFGSSAELGWEKIFGQLAESYRVIAPDHPGYGGSAKAMVFGEGREWRLRHLAAFFRTLGLADVPCVGNSLGAVLLLKDAAAHRPLLPVSRILAICGGGQIQKNEHVNALYEYDCTLESMRRLVTALFHQAAWPADDAYVTRRLDSSLIPGSWEAIAAARFRRPNATAEDPAPTHGLGPQTLTVPTLFVEGTHDKLLPRHWARELAATVKQGEYAEIDNAGHCPQIECPEPTVEVLMEYLRAPA